MPPGPQAGSPQACPETKSILGFDIVEGFRRVIDGSLSFVFSSSHLASFTVAFSATLTTPAIVPAQLRWFGASPCAGDSGGPTPIANMASLPVVPIYIGSTLDVRGATSAPL